MIHIASNILNTQVCIYPEYLPSIHLYIGHSCLPDDLINTQVIPIVKNRTRKVSNINNYRLISLTAILASVLDGVLN